MELLLKTNAQRGRMAHSLVTDDAVAVGGRRFLATVENVLRPRTRTADISSDFEARLSYLQVSCLLNSTTNENECDVTRTLSVTNNG